MALVIIGLRFLLSKLIFLIIVKNFIAIHKLLI